MYSLAGIAAGLTFLVKATNIFIMVPLLFFSGLMLYRAFQEKRMRSESPRVMMLLVFAILPGIIWMGWNLHIFGDPTATSQKIAMLGWKVKAPFELFSHPLFSAKGAVFFLSELLRTFWRGELVWEMKRLSWNVSDAFYVYSTAALLIISGANAFIRRKEKRFEFFLSGVCFSCCFTAVVILAYLSIHFDFGKCWYPSRDNPYFTSGRLISGALVPFLYLYIEGAAAAISMVSKRINPLYVIGMTGAVILLCELCIKAPVFFSQYNFFNGL